jgi:hypothetical protein
MKKIHVTIVALLLGVSAVLGVVAATRTAGLGAAATATTHVTSASIAQRTRRLDRVEAALRKALRDRPPAFPAVPSSSRTASAATGVVYRRAAPIVVLRRSTHGDDTAEHEREHEGERDD